MSCHGTAPAPGPALAPDGRTIPTRVLLVGAPNVGKSTLFNTLTGARQHTTNAPGTTVELATGVWRTAAGGPGTAVTRSLVDLPGTYSLLARSADEQVTADAVRALAQAARTPEDYRYVYEPMPDDELRVRPRAAWTAACLSATRAAPSET